MENQTCVSCHLLSVRKSVCVCVCMNLFIGFKRKIIQALDPFKRPLLVRPKSSSCPETCLLQKKDWEPLSFRAPCLPGSGSDSDGRNFSQASFCLFSLRNLRMNLKTCHPHPEVIIYSTWNGDLNYIRFVWFYFDAFYPS